MSGWGFNKKLKKSKVLVDLRKQNAEDGAGVIGILNGAIATVGALVGGTSLASFPPVHRILHGEKGKPRDQSIHTYAYEARPLSMRNYD
jgi:hypothetical protein